MPREGLSTFWVKPAASFCKVVVVSWKQQALRNKGNYSYTKQHGNTSQRTAVVRNTGSLFYLTTVDFHFLSGHLLF